MSKQLLDVPQTAEYEPIREVLAAIDAVMVFPVLPTIPVRIVPDTLAGGAGAYVRQRGGTALRIEVAEAADYLELTTAHEVGHFLDDCGFHSAVGWASEADPRLEPLRQAWEETNAARTLRDALATGRITVTLPHGGSAEFPLMPEEAQNCRYYLQGRELFARSFAQYVAGKSGNRVLLDQVRQRRESAEGRFYHVQWTQTDFELIAEVFDRTWLELGWLR